MSSTARALYLGREGEAAFALLHSPPPGRECDTAVLLCPPFGWEEVCSYRCLRAWAQSLAECGHPTLRLTLPGTGDSAGGSRDPDRLGAWTRGVDAAASWLARESGASRVAAIGLGLGGMLCVRAAAAGAPLDDLVLWAVPSRGRSLVRQLRAFGALEGARFYEGLPVPPEAELVDGELEAGGFLLSPETVEALEALDLTETPLEGTSVRRVLLLAKDGIAPEERLRQHLGRDGAEVVVADGPGYGAMTTHPQRSNPPEAVMARVQEWLARSGPAGRLVVPPAPPAASSLELELDGAAVRETPVSFVHGTTTLFGVLAEPLEPPTHGLGAVLLNSGAVRHIGPSRMYVECARRWAALGVPTLRLDVEGIGESGGEVCPYPDDIDLYVPKLLEQTIGAIDHLASRGVPRRFVLAGLCSGAYWAFHGLLRDPRVSAALMINPRLLVWQPGAGPARDLRALLSAPSLAQLRNAADARRVRALLSWMLAWPGCRLRERLAGHESEAEVARRELEAAFEQVRVSGQRLLLLFSEHEPVHDELARQGQLERILSWRNVTLERIGVRDHTLRPCWAQQRAHEILDLALQAELDRELTALHAAGAS